MDPFDFGICVRHALPGVMKISRWTKSGGPTSRSRRREYFNGFGVLQKLSTAECLACGLTGPKVRVLGVMDRK